MICPCSPSCTQYHNFLVLNRINFFNGLYSTYTISVMTNSTIFTEFYSVNCTYKSSAISR